jgi:CheY-like chemotaxis protein
MADHRGAFMHKLLLADDSVTIQRVIELTFADEDISVVAVGDGQQAIEQIERDRPDIVLADVGMPERDGYEVASYIKNTPHLCHIPVLLLTGAFQPVDETRAVAVGCDGVLAKPFEPQMVINRVKELLAGGSRSARGHGERGRAFEDQRPASALEGEGSWLPDGDGRWAHDPGASGQAPQPIEPEHSEVEVGGPVAPSGSLDDYFDRLDIAFSGLSSEPRPLSSTGSPMIPPALSASMERASGEDLKALSESLGVPGFDDVVVEPVAQPSPRPAGGVPGTTPETGAGAAPSLPVPPAASPAAVRPASVAESFSVLLAAEQVEGGVVPTAAPPVLLSDETLRRIAVHVIERLTDSVVREAVIEVAERLVREEIERLKINAQ